MGRNSYISALKRFGAFALVGIIFVSLFATGIMARGSAEGAASASPIATSTPEIKASNSVEGALSGSVSEKGGSGTSSTDYVKYTHIEEQLERSSTTSSVIEITTVEELQAMRDNLAGNYVLSNDIDASDTINWNSGAGFEPIGPWDNPFTGSFDGQGYVISNLYIHRPGSLFASLFGSVESGGVIKNVGMEDVNLSGGTVQGGSLGGLVGSNYGTISNCYSTGSVSGNGDVNTGGLVGMNSGTVSNSYSACSVSGSYYYTGGLIGLNWNGTLSNCYANGSVSGIGGQGGLLGFNWNGTVSNCYATGSVTGDYWSGGLVGHNNGGTVSNSFWDIETSGQANSAGGTGKTTENMENVRTFTDNTWSAGLTTPWDFVGNPYSDVENEDIWDIHLAVNNGYPFLTALGAPSSFGYENIGAYSEELYCRITGSVFTCPNNGTADSITAYVAISNHAVKFAIYRHDDSSLVGATAWYDYQGEYLGWLTLNLLDPKPNLVADTEYVLVAWGTGQTWIYYDIGETDQGHYQSQPWQIGLPDPASFTHEDRVYSIYCNYTPMTIELSSFGYTSVGVDAQSIHNRITGSVFTCPSAGIADSITAYVFLDDGQTSTKGAIYRHSDLSKVRETEEFYRDAGSTFTGWHTYNISGTVNLEADEYVLVLLGAAEGSVNLYYDSGDTDQGHYQTRTYSSGFPDPASFTHEDRKYSIYCNYTPFVDVSISPSSQSGVPGSILNYTVTVTNNGSITDNYLLEVWDDMGFGITLDNYIFENVPPLGSRQTILRVTIPTDSELGIEDHITVTAYSAENWEVYDSASCTASVVDTTPPPVPQLISPINGVTLNDNTPTFKWSSVSDPSGVNYTLQIDNENTFTFPLTYEDAGMTNNTCTPPDENALANSTYHWRVRAVDGAGNVGSWSEIWQFIVDTTPPLTPDLILPENNGVLNDNTPTFDWTDVTDPSGVNYTLQYSTSQSFPAGSYRAPITIAEQSGSDLTDYQVRIEVTYNQHMQLDFDDLRFTDSDGTTPLSYWIESKTDGVAATVWVKVPFIPASPSEKTIYIYYGDPSATSASDGDGTLIFFDDFSGSYIDTNKWGTSISSGGSISVSDDKLTISQISGNPLETRMWTNNNYPKNTITEFKVSQPDGWGSGYRQSWFGRGEDGTQGGSNRVAFWAYESGQRGFVVYKDGSSSFSTNMTNIDPTNEYIFKYVWVGSSSASLYVYDTDRSTLIDSRTLETNIPIVDLRVYFSTYSWNYVSKLVCDWTLLREYASTEPTTSVGSEEVLQSETKTIEGLTESTYTVPDSEALPENTYYWRVRAVDGASNQSDWSDVWQFTRVRYLQHGPIYIRGNENFTPANGVTGGSGTVDDPYIIEGWEIDASDRNGQSFYTGAIDIRGTTAHFVVQNCYIHGGRGVPYQPILGYFSAIQFENVQNGTIRNNRILDANWAISGTYSTLPYDGMPLSTSITVDNNWVENCSFGIFVNAYDVNIANNVIKHIYYVGGISTGRGRNWIVRNNYIEDTNQSSTGGNGIYATLNSGGLILGVTDNILVEHNTINNVCGSGIVISTGYNTTIRKNVVIGGPCTKWSIQSYYISSTVPWVRPHPENFWVYNNNFYKGGWYSPQAFDNHSGVLNHNWDDGVSVGNYWDDYSGSGPYDLYDTLGYQDDYPLLSPVPDAGVQ